MDILYDGFRYFIIFLVAVIITKIFMSIANKIGEELGIKEFVVNLLLKIGKGVRKLY
jgi:hypothetical protein